MTVLVKGRAENESTMRKSKTLSGRLPSGSSEFADVRSNSCSHAFNRHLEFFSSTAALQERYPLSKPKIILAVPQDLSYGLSRSFFTEFAAIPGNVVLLTSRGGEGTLARQLFDQWNEAQEESARWGMAQVGTPVPFRSTIELQVGDGCVPSCDSERAKDQVKGAFERC